MNISRQKTTHFLKLGNRWKNGKDIAKQKKVKPKYPKNRYQKA